MHQTKLIEFVNENNDLLRGIVLQKSDSKKAVLMCGGFERSATVEKKFKVLADKLIEQNILSLRFDYTGCGLSDGDFSKTTVKKMSNDVRRAISFLKKETGLQDISIVSHSLSACVVANLLCEVKLEKIILIAPALNQKDLLRYWFVLSDAKNKNFGTKINWNNFKNYLDELRFEEDCQRTDKMTKANYISYGYFLENKDTDYSIDFKNTSNVLHIHGDIDDKVPYESINVKFNNKIIIKDGDHDLERPDMFERWINSAVGFIS